MSWILISLMAAAATIVMLCFSNVWSDMQRRGDRESKMDFKAETSKVLRGARSRPVLLAEKDLEEDLEEDLEKDLESRSHSWIGFKDLKTSFQEQQQTVRNREPAKEMVVQSNPIMCQPCHVKPTHPQNGLKLFDILGLNPRRFIVIVQVKSL